MSNATIRSGTLLPSIAFGLLLMSGSLLANENLKLKITNGPTITNPTDVSLIFDGTQVFVSADAEGRTSRELMIDFGDGPSSVFTSGLDFGFTTMLNASYTYTTPGTFTITAKAIHGPPENPEKIKAIKTIQVVVQETPRPVVNVIQPVDGAAPFALVLDASTSTAPTGETIVSYTFDDGTGAASTTQASPIFNALINTPATYTAVVTALSDSGETSLPAYIPYVVGDGETGDGDLFVNKGQFTDTGFKFDGDINPRGGDFSSATVKVDLNGVNVASATGVRSRSSARSQRAKGFNFIPIIRSNGRFSLRLTGGNLKRALGLRKQNGNRKIRTEINIEIGGTTLATTRIKGIVESDFSEKDTGSARGKFSFISLNTPTGAFKSQRSSARLGKTSGYTVSLSGPILGQFSQVIEPTGDVVITIGDATTSTFETITIPAAAFITKGTSPKTVLNYSAKLGTVVTGLKKFQINNSKRKFILVTTELANTGLPGVGTGGTSFTLPVIINVTTATGPRQLTTRVEFRRKDASSGSWKR